MSHSTSSHLWSRIESTYNERAQDQEWVLCWSDIYQRTHHLITALQVNHAPHPSSIGSTATVYSMVTSSLNSCNGRALLKRPRKASLNMLQSAQLANNGPHVPPSTPQVMNCTIQHAVDGCSDSWFSNSSSGVQTRGGIIPVSMNPAAVNSVTSVPIVTQAASICKSGA